MSLPMIQNVCLVGANGTLGTAIAKALLSSPFTVSVLRRESSTSPPVSPSFASITVSDALPLAELTSALRNQHAVVAAFPLKDVTQHLRLAQAAHDAGVRRYIPADYGSCDAASPLAQHHLQLYRDKTAVRAACEALAASSASSPSPFTWTSLVCGHFFDHGLRDGLLHFDLAARTALILDDGSVPASASTLSRVADAVVRVLQRPDQTANRALYIQSFCASQLDILASLERVTRAKWHAQHVDSAAYLDAQSKRLADGCTDVVEDIVFVLGTLDADWRSRRDFAMDLLGLEDEQLDHVVAAVVSDHATESAK